MINAPHHLATVVSSVEHPSVVSSFDDVSMITMVPLKTGGTHAGSLNKPVQETVPCLYKRLSLTYFPCPLALHHNNYLIPTITLKHGPNPQTALSKL